MTTETHHNRTRWTTPTVRELPRNLQPTARDDFGDDACAAAPARPPRAPAAGGARPPRAAAARRPLTDDADLAVLVSAARAGDEAAWSRLVARFDRRMRGVARCYRLPAADVDEVLQVTWLQLLENIQRIREPAAVGAWLVTATRRNALRRRQMHVRELLSDDPELGQRADGDEPGARLLVSERDAALSDALQALPERHRRLLVVLLTRPTLDYRQIAELLSMPIGSIGPIRARALARLARDPQLRAISA
jgi:RNA polymerase sigma factor (sigma-70 family)